MASKIRESRRTLSLAIALALTAGGPQAATITVTDGGDAGDSGTCTLRQAIGSANNDGNGGTSNCADGNGADTIVFDAGLSPSTVTLGGSEIAVTSSVTIDGGAAGWDIRANETAPYSGGAYQAARVLNLTSATLTLDHMQVSYGYGDSGGCIRASNSSIALNNSSVRGCKTYNYSNYDSGNGGAIAIYSSTLTLDHSNVIGGFAGMMGGVVYASGSDVTAIASTIRGGVIINSGSGGVLSLSGGSSLALVDSEVDDGFTMRGALVSVSYSSMIAVNSTLTGGHAEDSDGERGYCGAINAENASVTLVNATLSGNSALIWGGAICANFGATVTMQNSIVSGNTVGVGGTGPDVYSGTYSTASTVSADHSLLGLALQSNYGGNGNQYSDTPGLGSLTDNGGPTKTMALNSDSPAIDTGSVALAVYNSHALNYDQRGIGFPRTLSGSVDIGAFQHQPAPGDRIFVSLFETEP